MASLTVEQYQALLAGLPKYWPNQVFLIAGQSLTVPQIVSLINANLSVMAAAALAKGEWKAAEATEETTLAKNEPILKVVRDQCAEAFSNAPAALAALDVQPRKARKPLTTAERAAANAKRQATRKARGTTSKKQKATITGDVTGVSITPITTGAAATPPTTASTASSGGASTGSTPTVSVGAVASGTAAGTAHP